MRTIAEGLDLAAPLAGTEAVDVVVRGAHDGFDGVYREFVRLSGTHAMPCTKDLPCSLAGCTAAVCGQDERPVVSGFVTPTDGWTTTGAGLNQVFARAVAPRGQATEPTGADDQPEPPSAYFGTGSGPYDPVYLLEGATKTIVAYGGSCNGDFTTPCATSEQCLPVGFCDPTAPPDGRWALACSGDPVTGCTLYVNPDGVGDPRAGHPIWIPDRNALLVLDGRGHDTAWLTIARLDFEGTRWAGLDLQVTRATHKGGLALEDLAVRWAPHYGVRTQQLFNFALDTVLVENGGRGTSFDTGGTFGGRFLGLRGSTIDRFVGRHCGAAGLLDRPAPDGSPAPDGRGDGTRDCPYCDTPWNDPSTTVWGTPCEALDVEQARSVSVSRPDVVDVRGGVRVDTSRDVRVENGRVERAQGGVAITQESPSVVEGALRTWDVVVRQLRIDRAGDATHGAIGVGSGVVAPGDAVAGRQCISPLQKDELLEIYDNAISRPGYAGIVVCQNPKLCNDGVNKLGACTSDQDCPHSPQCAGCSPDDAKCPCDACVATVNDGAVRVYNNTVWSDGVFGPSAGVAVESTVPAGAAPTIANLLVANNVVSDLGRAGVEVAAGTVANGMPVLDANLYDVPACLVRWGAACFATIGAVRGATGQEMAGLQGDPAFVDTGASPPDLHIGVVSDARDAGLNLHLYSQDIDFQARGQKWDVGADEFRCTDDASCEDGDPCNGTEKCFNGFCGRAAGPPDCNDHDACTADFCKAGAGCVHRPLSEDEPCDDGNACTSASVCRGGNCVVTALVQCPSPAACFGGGQCDPATGSCSAAVALPDGAQCEDGDVCTIHDSCQGGVCAGQRCGDDPCLPCTPVGCLPFVSGSFESVVCSFARSVTPSPCAGQRVPTDVGAQLGAGRVILEQAGARNLCGKRSRNPLRRASLHARAALRRLDKRRTRLTPECYDAVRALLHDARKRSRSAGAACAP